MTKKFILLLFLFLQFACTSQQNKNKFDKLTSLTTDTYRMEVMKSIMLSDVLDIERDEFIKDYDTTVDNYYNELEKYYRSNYTDEEIDAMILFFESSAGNKLAEDQRKILHNNFPEINPLQDRISEIKKNITNLSITFTPNDYKISDNDISIIINSIGVPEYLNIIKEYESQWVEPQYEAKFRQDFENMQNNYLNDIANYYQNNYTAEEIDKILAFYETGTGRKMAKNNQQFITTAFQTYGKWVDSFKNLESKLKFGKYQNH